MILSNNNGTFTPVAGGTGTFIGTAAAFNAVKATLPVNTVAYITDDGNGDLQPVDAVTNGDMHPVTSNAVYDALANYIPSSSVVDTVADGNSNPVTSNAVYDALNTVITGTATIDTTNVNSGIVTWKRLGRLVFVTISDLSPKSTSSNIRLATGLPKCLGRQDYVISGSDSYCDVGVDATNLYAKYGAQRVTTALNGSLVYIYDPS